MHLSSLLECERLKVETKCFKIDRKSTRLNSSHLVISYAVFCLKKKNACISLRAGSSPDNGHANLHPETLPGIGARKDESAANAGPYAKRAGFFVRTRETDVEPD